MDFLELENKIVCQKLKIKGAMEDIKEFHKKSLEENNIKEANKHRDSLVAGEGYIAALEFVQEQLYKD